MLGAAATGCVSERERLDVPTVTLNVTSPAPPPGGRVTGRAEASDGSGLTSLAVYACTADSVFRDNAPLDRERSVTLDFSLHVSSAAAAGAPVEVYAATFDDQGFVAEASQVVYVGGVTGPSGEGLCRRVRPATAVIPASLPTAPTP